MNRNFLDYFKKDIDWKTFNYINDMSTTLEDVGHIVDIIPIVFGHHSSILNDRPHMGIFISSNGEFENIQIMDQLVVRQYKDCIAENGTGFLIKIYLDDLSKFQSRTNYTLLNGFRKIIEGKLSDKYKVYLVYNSRCILVKPIELYNRDEQTNK